MADANTTRYQFVKPEVGASADTWGAKLNTNLDDVDALIGAITTAGSSNAYALTTGLSLAAYVAGQSFDIKASFSNSGAVTIAVDGLATKAITKNGTTALVTGDLVSGQIYRISYDGTQFQLVGTTGTGVYQPLDATLTALAGLSTSASQYIRATGTDAFTMDSYAAVLSNIGALDTTSGDARYAQLGASNTLNGLLKVLSTIVSRTAFANIGVLSTDDSSGIGMRISCNGAASDAVLWQATNNSFSAALTFASLVPSTGAFEFLYGVTAPVAAVTGVFGTLTTAHRNRHLELSGGVTMPNSVFTAEDKQTFDPGTSNRTFTRGSGVTMYVNGVDSATATLPANQVGGAHWRTASIVVLAGPFV